MAQEIDLSAVPDATASTPAVPEKKKRRPRAKKTDDAVSTSEPVRKSRGGRPKRTEVASAKSVSDDPKGRGRRGNSKVQAGNSVSDRGATASLAASSLGDDISDLLQLEEENQRLRKSLAEKLRAENASLRGRLGMK